MLKRRAPSTRSAFLVRLCLALSVLVGAVALLSGITHVSGITQAGYNAGRSGLASGGGLRSKLIIHSVPTRAGRGSAGAAGAGVATRALRPRPVPTTRSSRPSPSTCLALPKL